MSAGAPVAMMRPLTSTEMRSARRNTASMSCSTSSTVTLRADALDQRDHALRLLRPHAGHRLVEQHQLRAAWRAPGRPPARAARRGTARRCVERCLRGQADFLGDRARFVEQRRLLRTGRQNEKLEPLRACTASARLSSTREAAEDAGDLVAAREAGRDALVRRQPRDVVGRRRTILPPSLASCPRSGRSAWSCRRRSGRSARAPRRAGPRGRRGRWRPRRRSASRGRFERKQRLVLPAPAAGDALRGEQHDGEQHEADAEVGVLLVRRQRERASRSRLPVLG